MRRTKRRYRDDYGWGEYVPVAQRRAQAAREMAKLAKEGHPVSPVVIEGLRIARTFWGKAWCDNLERYSDFANRMPRGRTYVRNGSVVDLQVAPGEVTAIVSGSDLYRVNVTIAPVPGTHWDALCKDCGGAVDSVVELLQGRFSKAVMGRICQAGTGLFPAPAEIQMACSCPDWATMCKHVAAVLYGIGARLDERPELLFRLRQVDEAELIASAASSLAIDRQAPASGKVLEEGDLSAIFGVEIAAAEPLTSPAPLSALPTPPRGRVKAPASPAARPAAARRPPRVRLKKAPAAVPAPALPDRPAVLAKGTEVRMLAGKYAGYAGHVASARAQADSQTDAIYTLALTGPDGHRARTTVKHASLGRTWAVV